MFLASSLTTNQIDVWGSAYAVALGVTTSTQADAIATWLKSNYDGVVENGQLRHLPAGEYWRNLLAGYAPGTYQNGAFWATPVGWLIVALDRGRQGARAADGDRPRDVLQRGRAVGGVERGARLRRRRPVRRERDDAAGGDRAGRRAEPRR